MTVRFVRVASRAAAASGLRAHEPLGLEARLHDVVAALTAPHDHLVRLAADEVAGRLEVGEDALARRVALEPRVVPAGGRDVAVVAHHVDERQVVALPRGVVVVVVGRGDLHGARAEGRIDDRVGDDRHEPIDEGDPCPAADEVDVAGIVGVDGDAGVAEDRLGPRGGDRHEGARLVEPRGLVDQVVADRPERARLGRRHHLEVRQAGPAAGAPVDERLVAVGQPLAVEPGERLAHGPAGRVVHREAEAAPVDRRAQAPLLAQDHLPGLVDEAPHPLEVPLATQARPRLAVRGDDPVEDELGGDAGVVEAGQEERRAPLHPGVARHEVLDGAPLGVPEVQAPGDVGGRLDDHEGPLRSVGSASGTVRGEDVGGQPALVDGALELDRPIGLGEPVRRAPCSLRHRLLPLETRTPRSSSGRTGSWCHLLVRAPARSAHRGRGLRGPSRRAIGRRPHGSRATFAPGSAARLAPSRARFGPCRRYSSRSPP